MANAKFCAVNFVVQEETTISISSGGEDPFYPVSNLKHPHVLKTFRSSGSVTSVLVLDMQTAVTVDMFMALASSIGTLDLTAVTIEANPANIWTSPGFTTTITDFDYVEGIASKTFAAQTYRYWRLTLVGTSDYVEVGKLLLGEAVALTSNNIDIGFKFGSVDLSDTTKGRYGQRFIDRITDQDIIQASISLMTKDETATMKELFDYCGTHTPVWVILDPDQVIVTNKDILSGCYYFTERPMFNNDFYGLYSTEFELEEAK